MLSDCLLTGNPFASDLTLYCDQYSATSYDRGVELTFRNVEHIGKAPPNLQWMLQRKIPFRGVRLLHIAEIYVDKKGSLYSPKIIQKLKKPVDYFDVNCCFCSQPGDAVFGHWIFQTLPRAWFYSQKLQGKKFKCLFHKRAKSMFRIFEHFFKTIDGFDGAIFLDDDPVGIRDLYFCDKPNHGNLLYNSNYLQFRKSLFENIKLDTNIHSPAKIYFSRSNWSRSYRFLTNRKKVENLFRTRGYEIVSPEEYGLVDMMNMLQSTKILAGERGSALHLSAFSESVETSIVLSYNDDSSPMWPAQAGLGTACNQNTVFIFGEGRATGNTTNDFEYTISLEDVDSVIDYCV